MRILLDAERPFTGVKKKANKSYDIQETAGNDMK